MNQLSASIWGAIERETWKPPDPITVAEWAEQNRVLDVKNTAESGPWKNSRTPYMAEVMNALVDPRIEEITFMGPSQIAKTESVFNMLGYIADQDPGPTLFVKAREDDAYSDGHNRLRTMFAESPRLLKRIPSGKPEDLMMKEFRLDRMTLFFAGSNSPAALSGKPIRYLFLDETDKYPRFSGREASPIKLARERTRTFWNRKIAKFSTPTTKHGYIYKEFQKSDQRKFYVPCPHCGHYQILYFQQIIIPKEVRDPGLIRELKVAYYECEECKAKIRDHQKPQMLVKGKWVGKGQGISSKGIIEGERKLGNHAGFWLNACYSPWLTFSEIMAEFLESKDDDESLMNFVNSWLAEIWQEKAEFKDSVQIIENKADYAAAAIPGGAVLLTSGVDVQKHFVYYVVRAWGAQMRSWLIEEGELPATDGFEQVDSTILDRTFFFMSEDRALSVALVCMDSGYRTDEVYNYVRSKPLVRPIKGASRSPQRPFWSRFIEVHPMTGQRLKRGVRLWLLDTEHFKDFIFRRMSMKPDNPFGWHVHQDISLDYADQITSEKKVVVRRGRQEWEEWQPKSGTPKNHLWDAEVYAAAAAHMMRNKIEGLVKRRETETPQPETEQTAKVSRRPGRAPWVQAGVNWTV